MESEGSGFKRPSLTLGCQKNNNVIPSQNREPFMKSADEKIDEDIFGENEQNLRKSRKVKNQCRYITRGRRCIRLGI